MPVKLKNGIVLLSGGSVALEDDCCCCDFEIVMGYTTGFIHVTVQSTTGDTTMTTYNLRIYRNGILVYSEDNRTGSITYSVAVTAGQTVTANATGVYNTGCIAEGTCTRYSVVIPEITPCTPFNPDSFVDGGCYSATEFYAGYQYNPHTITAVVSGLSGPMASLNGTYTVDCEDTVANASTTWSSTFGTATGSIQIIWVGPYNVTASVVSRVPNGLGGFTVGGRDFAADYGTSSKIVNIKAASCASCTSTLTGTYTTEGPVLIFGTSTGQPADTVSIAWTFA